MLTKMTFERMFSKTMHKDLKLPLGEMSFYKDFVNDTRGDLYPIIEKSADCLEAVRDNRYVVENGSVRRMFVRYFPFATYQVSFSGDACGFSFCLPNARAEILWKEGMLHFCCAEACEQAEAPKDSATVTMAVSCRPGAFDVYFMNNGMLQYYCTFRAETFAQAHQEQQFKKGYAALSIEGSTTVYTVSACIDCGISQADIRSIRYENGDAIFENGEIFFTASVRMQESAFQGIFAWTPGTENIRMTGAVFFDCNDGYWRNYLASSLLYDRNTKQWYIWTSSFEHKHILCHGAFEGDVRFGVNVVDVEMMPEATHEDVTQFVGFKGDEDPDLFYNEEDGKWYMAICRIIPEVKKYRYLFFRSDSPFEGYTYIGQGMEGAETGGSFVKAGGELFFVCGNSFQLRANYRIYSKNGMQEAKFTFDDGGFRGWGTVIPLKLGSRTRYFWLTFDRHNGSSYNWSYGNFYCFEGAL